MKRFLAKLLPGLCVVLLAGTAMAGGVVVSLDGAVPSPEAGKPFDVSFTIYSAHDGSTQNEFHPLVMATNTDTGETITARAEPAAGDGRYAASMTLPTAGTWEWKIVPEADYPQDLVNQLTPLTVSAPVAAQAAAPAAFSFAGVPVWLIVAVVAAVAVAALTVLTIRRAPQVRA